VNEFFYVEDVTDKMQISQIKSKIKNMGDFSNIKEIKEAGLRIVFNKKSDSYWLIEDKFLKPLMNNTRGYKSIIIKIEDCKNKIFLCYKSKMELRETKAIEYILWGERQKFHKRPTCISRKNWWNLVKQGECDYIFLRFRDKKNWTPIIPNEVKIEIGDVVFIGKIYSNKKWALGLILNSTMEILMSEIYGRVNLGDGLLTTYGPEIRNFIILNPDLLNNNRCKDILFSLNSRMVFTIFQELGLDSAKPIRDQEPNPLPDRKALDDVVFDALGLTDKERKEVYWATAELVKNRIDKARSVKKK